MRDPSAALSPICQAMGISQSDTLREVTFNGEALGEVYPWGTISQANPAANYNTATELSGDEITEIRLRAWQYLDVFHYTDFIK